jgi:RNA polymerase sigma factor (sigma-70 family)
MMPGRTSADDDADLLACWRSGDNAAGRRLFERHVASVAKVFRHKADEALHDLVQNTFLRLLQVQHELREASRFRPFLLGIARNELLRHLEKRAGPRGRIDPLTVSIAQLATSLGQRVDRSRERQRLLAALQQLPLELQLTIEFFYWQELSGRELAEALGVPEGTVRSRLRLARTRLREELVAQGDAGLPEDDGALDAWARTLHPR